MQKIRWLPHLCCLAVLSEFHLDPEPFLLLDYSPSDNVMGKDMSLTPRKVTLGSLSFPLFPGAKLS